MSLVIADSAEPLPLLGDAGDGQSVASAPELHAHACLLDSLM